MTTVTISEDTHRKLKKLKNEEGFSSFDELLDKVADERLQIPSSDEMFGSMDVKDKERIRDHSDRTERYE